MLAERLDLPYAAQASAGVWVVAVPIPNNPLLHVLVYAIASGSGVVLTWKVPHGPRYLQRSALAEAFAHLIHLETRGRVKRTGVDPMIWTVTP
ncbi:MAG: hypothetical protein QOE61_57 [Micromonosporaceae bacterium]|jgi:acyl-CoA thioesterase|nr:hypothetical protein [Micromonosporaceae bacterium]